MVTLRTKGLLLNGGSDLREKDEILHGLRGFEVFSWYFRPRSALRSHRDLAAKLGGIAYKLYGKAEIGPAQQIRCIQVQRTGQEMHVEMLKKLARVV